MGRSEWAVIPEGPPWAVDAWGLGCLLQETFSSKPLMRAEDLRQTASIPPAVLQASLFAPGRKPSASAGHTEICRRCSSCLQIMQGTGMSGQPASLSLSIPDEVRVWIVAGRRHALRDGAAAAALQEYQRLLSSQPARRLNPAKLAGNPVLHNKLVDITAALENLSVRTTQSSGCL